MLGCAIGCLLLVFMNMQLLLAYEIPGNISLPEAILVHGSPLGYGNFSRDSVRKRRNIVCKLDEHAERNRQFCCKKCQRGFYKSSDCKGPGLMTECKPCSNRTYIDMENYISRCRKCSTCQEDLGHVAKSDCISTQDTICGCPKSQYQVQAGNTFQCKNCSECQNGRVLTECVGYNDTLCSCFFGFYFTMEDRSCRPCEKCQDSDCEKHCGSLTAPSFGLSLGHSPLLLSMMALLAVGFILMLLGFAWQYWRRKKKHMYCHVTTVSTDHPSSEQLVTAQSSTTYLPGHPVSQLESNEMEKAASESEKHLTSAQNTKLPDCINDVVKAQIPEKPWVLYAVVDNVPPSRWKEFMRRLGLSDYDIERIEMQNDRRYREAQYEMLLAWRERTNQAGSTVEAISRVLREMELSGCSEKIQESLQREL
ncbi:tumor necrosis factor receptor superfamily member 1A [Microcaecilia unicolor]|uniref:Tumor necrosis factor receptor superfamily member 1A n=1 Tax=Microcaecilia unicolor TaxID=1415580 RepID=A0A6P7WQ98_9AMPH|nr:tumor necrosis factor receptor superfamily member 1A [Microcaecilia unicolor]